jgi:hypothetical protein
MKMAGLVSSILFAVVSLAHIELFNEAPANHPS